VTFKSTKVESLQAIFVKGLKPELSEKQVLAVLRATGFCYPQQVCPYLTRDGVRCADIYFTS
jgi:hypothetical protein